MSNLIPLSLESGVPLVDSRVIAEKCEIDHRSLFRLLLEHQYTINESFGVLRFEIAKLNPGETGRPANLARLTEDQATFLVTLTRNTEPVIRFKAALVAAFSEAKRQLALSVPALPQTYADALRTLAAEVEAKERLALENASMKPKADFVDRYVEANGSKGFRQVAKLINANEHRFREFLRDEKIMYQLGGDWVPYQDHIDAKRFEVKTGEKNEHAYNQARFTPKGVEWIAGLWAVHNLRTSEAV